MVSNDLIYFFRLQFFVSSLANSSQWLISDRIFISSFDAMVLRWLLWLWGLVNCYLHVRLCKYDEPMTVPSAVLFIKLRNKRLKRVGREVICLKGALCCLLYWWRDFFNIIKARGEVIIDFVNCTERRRVNNKFGSRKTFFATYIMSSWSFSMSFWAKKNSLPTSGAERYFWRITPTKNHYSSTLSIIVPMKIKKRQLLIPPIWPFSSIPIRARIFLQHYLPCNSP